MSKFQKKLDDLEEQRKKISKEIIELVETSEDVKKYLDLIEERNGLYHEQISLYKDDLIKNYNSCKHILVYTRIRERCWKPTYKDCGCIKCGLDSRILSCNRETLFLDEKIMYDYLKEHPFKGIETEISCDLFLAMAIYAKIKGAHPDIDEETAIKYFEISLERTDL